MKKQIIWSNMNLEEDNLEEIYDEYECRGIIVDRNEDWLDDERINLDEEVDGRIIIIADLGLWNGRKQGYKILGTNISDILYERDAEYCEWYSDGYNIKGTAVHHDGTNYYEYRVIREDMNIDNLLNAILEGKKIDRKTLNRYTRSLLPDVAEIYGWN